MKWKKYAATAICLFLAGISFTGCGNSKDNVKTQESKSGYYFESGTEKIYMNSEVEPLVAKLGEPTGGTYEAVSCAFEGKDTFYYYDGFTLQAYEKNGKKYVYTINLEDDTVKTAEGIKIGDSLSMMAAQYGLEYTVTGNAYVYTKDKMTLTLIVENDKISAITYALITN